MSAIQQALSKLDQAVNKLEGSMTGLEVSLAGQQRDMFPGEEQKVASNGNGHAPENALIAKRLDHAIEKVEGLLEDA